MPQPWERQPGETPKAYAAFCQYRKLGPEKRSLEAVTPKAKKGHQKGQDIPGYIKEWSSQNKWVDRAAAYDDHLDAVRRAASERAIAEMSRKHAQGMREIFDKGVERLKELNGEDISGSLALGLALNGMKGERLARGLTTDKVDAEVEHSGRVEVVLKHVPARER